MKLSLVEYGRAADYAPIPKLSISETSRAWKQRLGVSDSPLSIEGNQVKAMGVAGFINIDGIDIEIMPKFLSGLTGNTWQHVLWNILSLLDNYDNNIHGEASIVLAGRDSSFLDIIGQSFLNSIDYGIKEGFPREYISKEGLLRNIKGSIDYSKIDQSIKTPFMFPCRYDEYSEQNTLNGFLKWAGYMLSSRVRSHELSNRLRNSVETINAEAILPSASSLEALIIPPQYSYLNVAHLIAKALAIQNNFLYEENTIKSFGFLWKTHDVFENFVGLLLKLAVYPFGRSYRLSDNNYIKVGSRFSNASTDLTSSPDFIIRNEDRPVYILDAKYKMDSTPKASDVNQIISACLIEKCQLGVLIYPAYSTETSRYKVWDVKDTEYPKYIVAMYLDLDLMSNENGEDALSGYLHDSLGEIRELLL